jgi:hypothetical protein
VAHKKYVKDLLAEFDSKDPSVKARGAHGIVRLKHHGRVDPLLPKGVFEAAQAYLKAHPASQAHDSGGTAGGHQTFVDTYVPATVPSGPVLTPTSAGGTTSGEGRDGSGQQTLPPAAGGTPSGGGRY